MGPRLFPRMPIVSRNSFHSVSPNTFPGHYAAATKVAALLRGMEIELLLATLVHTFHNAKN